MGMRHICGVIECMEHWSSARSLLDTAQYPCMVSQMVGDEGRDEIVAVVVGRVATQGEGLPGLGAGFLEQLRMQLFGQKFVGQPLVDQDAFGVGRFNACAHENAGVMV